MRRAALRSGQPRPRLDVRGRVQPSFTFSSTRHTRDCRRVARRISRRSRGYRRRCERVVQARR
eukprot:2393788-Prymnesium_polylepis.1